MTARVILGGALAAFAFAACLLPGPERLIAEANAELVVTGVDAGDTLVVDVAGDRFKREADDDDDGEVRFYFTLPRGESDAHLRVLGHGEDALCAEVTLDVSGDATLTTRVSIDVTRAAPCDIDEQDAGVPDAGVDAGSEPERELVVLRETVTELCGEPPCEVKTTTVDTDGRVTLAEEEEEDGVVAAADFAIFLADALSPEADALFAGTASDCPTGTLPGEQSVVLARTIRIDGVAQAEQSVDAHDCGGIAATLRARLALFRELIDDDGVGQ